MTRNVGIVLIVVAVAVCVVGDLFLGVGAMQDTLTLSGAVLGFGLLLVVIVGPLVVGGVLIISRARQDQTSELDAANLRKILDMGKTRGQVNISDVVIELTSDTPAVQGMVYKLVGMGVFSGYVNWDDGVLYSAEAANLRDLEQCKHCNGQLKLSGKGVVKCPYCGTEYFIGG